MKITPDTLAALEAEVEQGYVRSTRHPEAPYTLYTYTQRGVIAGDWTEARKMARGLIVDDEQNIVARPFPKFFNWGELADEKQTKLRGQSFVAFEKLDGSLGILYRMPDGEMRVATRGSFESDQAQWATEWINQQDWADALDLRYTTICVEIIYPSNRIVIDYGDRAELVYLATVSHLTGWAHFLPEYEAWYGPTAKRFEDQTDLDALAAVPDDGTHEGYVLNFDDGTLVKVKLDEYVRLHRIVTNTTARTVWEHLRSGQGIQELVDRVPEEFEWWVRETADALWAEYHRILEEAASEFHRLQHLRPDRKLFAEEAKKYVHPGLLFSMLDGKPIDDAIWKMLRPEHETPFKIEER